MSIFTTYLEQVKTEMNPDEMALKKLAVEIIGFNSDFISKDKTSTNLKEFIKFLFYKLAIKSTKLNTIKLWEKIDKVFNNIRHNFSNTYSVILGKTNTHQKRL
jgi:CRISPR/Cas system-associated protein Csm6